MKRLGELLKVWPGEGRTVGLLVGLMALTSMGGSIGGTGIEALFYARFGVDFLPYMYMALGPTVLLTSLAITGLLGRVQRERLFTLLPIILALTLIAERVVVGLGIAPFYAVMWVLMNVMGMLQGLLTWGLAGAVTDTRQAKRLFPLFSAGNILGAVVGGFGTAPLVSLVGAENLLLVWAGALLLAFGLGQALIGRGRRAPQAPPPRRVSHKRQPGLIAEMQAGFRFVRRSPLMRWMTLATILSSILLFSLAFPFSKAATAAFKDADSLAGFLGLFNGVSTGAALLVSLVFANRLFARFGIMSMIVALPLIYLAGFSALSIAASFAMLVGFRFVQVVWLQGVYGSAYQALFNVAPTERRDQTRAFFNGVPEQAGTVIAGLVLVIGDRLLSPGQLYLIGLATAVIGLGAVWFARRAYADALVDLLKLGQPQVFVGQEDSLGGIRRDAAAVAAVMAGMSGSDPVVRRVSTEILADLPVAEATPLLVKALADPDAAVRSAALRGLARAGATGALGDAAACLDDAEPEVRMQAIAALSGLAADPHALARLAELHLSDPDPGVRASVALALLRAGNGTAGTNTLIEMASDGDSSTRASALEALGQYGHEEHFERVAAALNDGSPPVRQAAAGALAAISPQRAAPILAGALGDDDPAALGAVAAALGGIGEPARREAIQALSSPALEGGALLALEAMPGEPDGEPLRNYAHQAAERALRYHDLWQRCQAAGGNDRQQLLADSLRGKSIQVALNVIRAAGLLGDRQAVAVAIRNLQSPDRNMQANALETLESVADAHLVRPVLAVWEQTEGVPAAPDDWLKSLLEDADPWLRACAALVGIGSERADLMPLLARLEASDPDRFVRDVAASARTEAQAKRHVPSLSLMERILILKKARLFASLRPSDLVHLADLASEQWFADGDVITRQGMLGDEMYIIVLGDVRVMVAASGGEQEVARRTANDVVGEMAIISQEPRMATLIASGMVRMLVLSQTAFEKILRERPDTSLNLMRVLCDRLKEAQAGLGQAA